MLEVGNGKLTHDQNVSHFSLWCMMNSPLILGNDLRSMDEKVRAIVTNKKLIAINQDALGKQAKRVKKGGVDVLAKPLADGSTAICLFNKTSHKATAKYDLNKLADDKYVGFTRKAQYALEDAWEDSTLASDGKLSFKLRPYESKVFIVK